MNKRIEFKIGNLFTVVLSQIKKPLNLSEDKGTWSLKVYCMNAKYPFKYGLNPIYADIVYSDSIAEAKAKVFDFWKKYRHQFKHYLY